MNRPGVGAVPNGKPVHPSVRGSHAKDAEGQSKSGRKPERWRAVGLRAGQIEMEHRAAALA